MKKNTYNAIIPKKVKSNIKKISEFSNKIEILPYNELSTSKIFTKSNANQVDFKKNLQRHIVSVN